MSDLPDNPRYPPHHSQHLRIEAESLRKAGTAPTTHGHTLSADALAVLYRMSEQPETSADTLKILHELQTHQIELDLMQEQSEANEQEITIELERYRTLYDSAPVAYLVAGRDERVIECNAAGAALLRRHSNEVEGYSLVSLFSPDSRLGLNWRLKKLGSGSPGEVCTVQSADTPPASFRIHASLTPDAQSILVVLTPLEASPG